MSCRVYYINWEGHVELEILRCGDFAKLRTLSNGKLILS